ncbi:MAG: hypothetical protein ABL870_11150 [Sediminibacterium sp.]
MFFGKLIQYLFLVFVGFLLILLVSIILETPATPQGEYHYSSFLRNNYGITATILYLIAGLAVGYLMELKPWLAGICLILIFPLTSLYEATIYRGSHNLIPFEFLIFFLYALPSLSGAYLGKWLSDRAEKTN